MNFYIADTHFNNPAVIEKDKRPFYSVEEMNKKMIYNWNKVVKNNDTVYVLGDFYEGKDVDRRALLTELNGKKVLIRGNRDEFVNDSSIITVFDAMYDYFEVVDNRRTVVMSHYPILCHRGVHREEFYMLYGHVHTQHEFDFIEKWRYDLKHSYKQKGDALGHIYNVGCMLEYMDYTPRTLDEIIIANEGELI